ncbi:hypothetical protein A6V39_05410 [Candidatus Mycoplasma haematobovis]|uniref:Uncharacterized protein n=1 Tax=Candidatus Mycoplasma haematobovis TaxID=432608 RepID=A0A1A9QBD8_9MOLU|nr:hypothetical protein A6V39_05410 [Candidatus Mycoplasma haematobovis]
MTRLLMMDRLENLGSQDHLSMKYFPLYIILKDIVYQDEKMIGFERNFTIVIMVVKKLVLAMEVRKLLNF